MERGREGGLGLLHVNDPAHNSKATFLKNYSWSAETMTLKQVFFILFCIILIKKKKKKQAGKDWKNASKDGRSGSLICWCPQMAVVLRVRTFEALAEQISVRPICGPLPTKCTITSEGNGQASPYFMRTVKDEEEICLKLSLFIIQ